MKYQKGQIVIILLLVMVVALAIALSVVSRSVSEISTASKTEDSSRAFSAAEAGIEKILKKTSGSNLSLTLDNQSSVDASWDANLPQATKALEYPAFGKESFAQFWLSKPSDLASFYTADNFDVYFGDVSQNYDLATGGQPEDQPAIEVNIILKAVDGSYYSRKYFYDSWSLSPATGRNTNGFNGCTNKSATGTVTVSTNNYTSPRPFYCRVVVPPSGGYKTNVNDQPIMVRVRILYTKTSHPVALKPTSGSLPVQAGAFTSKGTAGNIQRTIQVFKIAKIMPPIFDYVLFSTNSITKQ